MRHNTMKNQSLCLPHLTIVTGDVESHLHTARLVDGAWNFAYTSLWNNTQFSTKETDAAKEKIFEYFSLAKDTRKAFVSFCQRVLLTRYYVNGAKGRHLPLPSVWFDKGYEYGFVSTRKWLQEVKAVRQSLPNHKQELKALAEAVLEFSEEPTVKNYQYWRGYFIEQKTPGLLSLFQMTAIQQLCN